MHIHVPSKDKWYVLLKDYTRFEMYINIDNYLAYLVWIIFQLIERFEALWLFTFFGIVKQKRCQSTRCGRFGIMIACRYDVCFIKRLLLWIFERGRRHHMARRWWCNKIIIKTRCVCVTQMFPIKISSKDCQGNKYLDLGKRNPCVKYQRSLFKSYHQD